MVVRVPAHPASNMLPPLLSMPTFQCRFHGSTLHQLATHRYSTLDTKTFKKVNLNFQLQEIHNRNYTGTMGRAILEGCKII